MTLTLRTSASLCAVVAVLVYLNSLGCGLVFDDLAAVKRNEDIRPSTSWLNLLYNDYWGKPMKDQFSHKSYRPLTVATFRLNYMLHELQPLGYHLVNVLLHSAVCYLYVLLCGVVFSEVWPALIAGLLFAVHPIHTEAVAGVVGRAELLAACFFIAAVFTHRRASRKGGVWWLLCSMVCVACSMLAKEQGITAAAICIVFDIVTSNSKVSILTAITSSFTTWRRASSGRDAAICGKLFQRTLSMVVFGVAAVALRVMWGGGRPGPRVFHRYVNPAADMATPHRQLSWLYLTFVNSWLLLNPYNLCADWRFGAVPLINSLIDPLNILTLLTLLSLAALGVWSVCGNGESHRTVVLSLSLLIFPYLPASNLFFPVGFVVAERVLYLPSMGFCMLVGYGAWHILQKTQLTSSNLLYRFMSFLLAFLILSHSLKTVVRNFDWTSGFSIYKSGIRRNPTSGVMLSNLGVEYAMKEDYETSELLYRSAMERAPDYSRAFFNFGKLMKIGKNYKSAEWGFRKAVELGRDDNTDNKQGESYYHLIELVATDPQRQDEALETCEEALEYAESFGALYIKYSTLLVQANRTYDALVATEMAARVNPSSSVAHYNLGLVHMKLNQLPQAAAAFRTALAIRQDNIQVMFNLASVLQVTANGHLETLQEALGLWIKLLSAHPHHTDALVYLASLYYELKDFSKTRHTLLQILQHSPNHTDTHYRLAILDYVQGNYAEAMETFSKVSLLQPGYKKTQSYLELTQRELHVQQRTS